MEPPSFDGGNQAGDRLHGGSPHASMEPPSFDGGNDNHQQASGRQQASFNGVAVFRRRKLVGPCGCDAVDTGASMEPPSFDGGNAGAGSYGRCAGQASMEPPSFDGGNYKTNKLARQAIRASMEPPSFDGGNHNFTLDPVRIPTLLQWSRRLSTAETERKPAAQEPESLASMEPPSFDGGNTRKRLEGEIVQTGLQWSRRLSTAETLSLQG